MRKSKIVFLLSMVLLGLNTNNVVAETAVLDNDCDLTHNHEEITIGSDEITILRAEIECSYWNGKHRMYYQGNYPIYGTNNILRYSNWRLYRCSCYSVVICQGNPPTGALLSYYEGYHSGSLNPTYYAFVTDAAAYYTTAKSTTYATFYN